MVRDRGGSTSTKRKAERENTWKEPSEAQAALWNPSAAKEVFSRSINLSFHNCLN